MDPRITKLAKILTDYSIKIKKGDIIELNFGINAAPLALECYKNILKKGALPLAHTAPPGFTYTYYKYASEEQLKNFPEISMFEAKKAAGSIGIGGTQNTKELTNIDPKKIALRSKIVHPISKEYLRKDNWVICEYPTDALAQDAEMSLEEFEDFFYTATNIDYEELSKKQTKLKQILDKGKHVRIVAPDTDIEFSIAGRTAIKCDGKRNVPDGEVFMAPVKTTVTGHIAYTYPAIKSGKEVDGIKLEFRNGKVARATAAKNEKFLKEMINLDKGSCYLGEFGVGMNYNIQKFIKQILFDEKIGGTIHLALGMAYKEGGGKNESALHWDMIKDLRDGGAIYVDGKLIQKNGKFTFKL
jgi:aminopeptidase